MKRGADRVHIHDVALRDGLQIEPVFVPTADKLRLCNALSRTGLDKIEVTSFTSPKAIPALADAAELMQRIDRAPGVTYAALVPNTRGAERALACGVDEINLVMSASDSHSQANLRMSPERSLQQFEDVVALVHQTPGAQVAFNASLSTAFGCPFDGEVPMAWVFGLIERIAALGIHRITLCDTTGMAHPAQVERLCSEVLARWPQISFTAHFHNTRGMGLANALVAWQAGIRRFDASLGGLGGCPFAPGASGNVSTEDLVHMFQAMGVDTGVDLDALLAVAAELPPLVGHGLSGQVLQAGPSTRRHALPV